jgi:glutamate-1-semialdehyde aminotransferase
MAQTEPMKLSTASRHLLSIKADEDELTPHQKSFIQNFITRYNKRTEKSKQYSEKYRPIFSDWINTMGYRQTLKEIRYPLVGYRSFGSRIWDIDDNEYIDLAMGYGVNLLGHSPDFLTQALEKQLKDGIQLAPMYDKTGEVAALICELTGAERVAFSNTGTEAVMSAIRLARAATDRNKIVLFDGSYHGHFDGVMVSNNEKGPFPWSPGTPVAMAEDVLSLKYGSEESLDLIRSCGHELAAVIVEPIQSRIPDFYPVDFLKELRQITQKTGTALIFDEVVTGFRVHPGGIQAYSNIRADITTYGKAVANGMPISIIAGKKKYLDTIDGGPWRFDDNSYPGVKPAAFAGTFRKHPLATTAAHAVLTYLKTQGPSLQENLNARSTLFANKLNAYFEQDKVPMKANHFGSIFQFRAYGKYDPSLQPIEIELLFHLMIEKGVYNWEKRSFYLSTAHTDQDLETIIRVFQESIAALRDGGFSFSI